MVGDFLPKCAGWENRSAGRAVAGFGLYSAPSPLDAWGKSGDVTSPSTARASKGFLYNIRRGGFIYLFISFFIYTYVRGRFCFEMWGVSRQMPPHQLLILKNQHWRCVELGMQPPQHLPMGKYRAPIDDAINPAYHLQMHLKQRIAKDDKEKEQ